MIRIGDRVTRAGALGTVEHVSSAAPYAVVLWGDTGDGWDRDLCPLADLTPTGKRGKPAWTGPMVTLSPADQDGAAYNGRPVRTKADPDEFQRVEELSPAAPGKRRAGRRERVIEPPAVEMGQAFEPTEVSTCSHGVVANPPHAPSGSSIDVGRTHGATLPKATPVPARPRVSDRMVEHLSEVAPRGGLGASPASETGSTPAGSIASNRTRRGRKKQWTRERIIDAIRRYESLTGAPPTYAAWNNPSSVSAEAREIYATGHWPAGTTVIATFGSWSAGIRAAGFEPRRPGMPPVAWTRDDIVERIREWVRVTGDVPGTRDWSPELARVSGQQDRIDSYDRVRWPHVRHVRRLFGTWSAAIRAAGYEPRTTGPRTKRTARPVESGQIRVLIAVPVPTQAEDIQPAEEVAA